MTLFLFLSACTAKEELRCDLPKTQATHLEKTDTANLSIFVDGTLSMAGYVSSGATSLYRKTLDSVDQVSTTAWSKPKYFRFGQRKQPIDRDTFRNAQLPSFYQDRAFGVSQVDKLLVDPPTSDQLNVIVTDLYQKNADLGGVQGPLTRNYLERGYTIGVLGVKSEFNGTIYDVGLTSQQFNYSTAGQSTKKYHPFYILVLGTYGNVYHFYEQLNQYGFSSIPHEFTIFSPQLVRNVSTLDSQRSTKSNGKDITRSQAIKSDNLLLSKANKAPVQFVTLGRRAETQSLSEALPYSPLEKVLQPSTYDFTRVEQQYSSKTKRFEPVSLLQGIQLDNWTANQGSLKFNLNLQPDRFDRGIYTLTASVFPKALQQPAWWQNWSSDEGGLDGSKTNNLFRFMNGLAGNTVESIRKQNNAIAQVCYAIQKK
jgi:hypothetical protein